MILLTGATGYVGGRLLRALEADGRQVRCLARRPEQLSPRVGPLTQVVFGDVLDEASLAPAFHGVTEAYYLIHSMGTSGLSKALNLFNPLETSDLYNLSSLYN